MTPTRTAQLAVAALLLVGCEGPPAVPPATSQSGETLAKPGLRPQLPKPNALRLHYDPSTRTLTLYDLPALAASWMLTLPGEPRGVPVVGSYQFPPTLDLDPDRVTVFYRADGGQTSAPVTLREVIEAREYRVSR